MKIKNISNLFILTLLFFQCVFPFQYTFIKVGLLGGIIFFFLIQIIATKKLHVNKKVFLWFLVYEFMNFLSIIVSMVRLQKTPLQGFSVNLVWPVVYFIILEQLYDRSLLKKIPIVLAAITSIACIYNFYYILLVNKVIPNILHISYPLAKINLGGINIGFLKIFSPNITNLIFLGAFCVSYFICSYNKVNKFFIACITGLIFINVFFTMRTAFIISIGLAVILTVALLLYLKEFKFKLKDVLKGVIIIALLTVLFNKQALVILDKVKYSFTGKTAITTSAEDLGSTIRMEQLKGLIKDWVNYPIIGSGNGVNSKYVVRSESSGVYELTYIAMLFQRGLVGVSIYFTLVVGILFSLIKRLKNNRSEIYILIPTIVAFCSIIFANATNPYIEAFDHLWMLFFPLVILNLTSHNNLFEEIEFGIKE